MKKLIINSTGVAKFLQQHIVIASAIITDFFISVKPTQGLLSPMMGNVGFRLCTSAKLPYVEVWNGIGDNEPRIAVVFLRIVGRYFSLTTLISKNITGINCSKNEQKKYYSNSMLPAVLAHKEGTTIYQCQGNSRLVARNEVVAKYLTFKKIIYHGRTIKGINQ